MAYYIKQIAVVLENPVLYGKAVQLTESVYVKCNRSRGQPHPKYKANSARASHIAVWECDLNCSLEDDWG